MTMRTVTARGKTSRDLLGVEGGKVCVCCSDSGFVSFVCACASSLLVNMQAVCECRRKYIIYCYKNHRSGEESFADLLENWSEKMLKIGDK